jgi:hypothetical protein
MQVVGHACEICERPIKSEIDGTGCIACERFFHDACVLAPRPEPVRSETYRTQADAAPRPPKKPRRKVRCPGCGADVRKEQRERDRATTLQREAIEEQRRVAAATTNGDIYARIMLVRIVLGLLLLAVGAVFSVWGR